jgi:hypothetical protein
VKRPRPLGANVVALATKTFERIVVDVSEEPAARPMPRSRDMRL